MLTNIEPFEVPYRLTLNDVPRGETTVAATLSEAQNLWNFEYAERATSLSSWHVPAPRVHL